jgi:hypothetical protein
LHGIDCIIKQGILVAFVFQTFSENHGRGYNPLARRQEIGNVRDPLILMSLFY